MRHVTSKDCSLIADGGMRRAIFSIGLKAIGSPLSGPPWTPSIFIIIIIHRHRHHPSLFSLQYRVRLLSVFLSFHRERIDITCWETGDSVSAPSCSHGRPSAPTGDYIESRRRRRRSPFSLCILLFRFCFLALCGENGTSILDHRRCGPVFFLLVPLKEGRKDYASLIAGGSQS
jgi:hypothetical protein